jgi:hypothetical protein
VTQYTQNSSKYNQQPAKFRSPVGVVFFLFAPVLVAGKLAIADK